MRAMPWLFIRRRKRVECPVWVAGWVDRVNDAPEVPPDLMHKDFAKYLMAELRKARAVPVDA